MKRNTTILIVLLVAGMFISSTVSAASATAQTADKTAPKISSFYPKSSATGISRTSTLYVKFSENIKEGANWSKIYVKNLKTGKKVAVSKSIKGSTLYLKTGTRASYTSYQVYIPSAAVKDAAGNKLAKYRTWKFKTGALAPILLDKGSKTVIIHQDVLYRAYAWTTYKYSNYYTKTVLTNTTYFLGTPYAAIKNTITIKKAGTNVIRVTQVVTPSGGKTVTYNNYYKYTGASAVKFYTNIFKKYFLKSSMT